MRKFYTGVGSRNIPTNIQYEMEFIGYHLQSEYIGRSGNAIGSDEAFKRGHIRGHEYMTCHNVSPNTNFEIYLPWKDYGKRDYHHIVSYRELPEIIMKRNEDVLLSIEKENSNFRYKYMKQSVKKLYLRNVSQIIGCDINIRKSDFVVCWTKDGIVNGREYLQGQNGTGGTGVAILVANKYNVPVYNLNNKLSRVDFYKNVIGIDNLPSKIREDLEKDINSVSNEFPYILYNKD